jgi:hypothetical protein
MTIKLRHFAPLLIAGAAAAAIAAAPAASAASVTTTIDSGSATLFNDQGTSRSKPNLRWFRRRVFGARSLLPFQFWGISETLNTAHEAAEIWPVLLRGFANLAASKNMRSL